MTPRYLLAVVFAVSLIGGATAKEKTKSPAAARSWNDVYQHAWKTGADWPIKPPMSRNLGYATDVVPAKGVSIERKDSSDGREHSVVIVHENDKDGKLKPVEMVLGIMRITEVKDGKLADGYRLRMTLDGKLLKIMHASGLAGHIVQKAIPLDSKQAEELYRAERKLYLNEIDLNQLKP